MAKQNKKSAYSPINHDKPRYNFTGCVTGLCKDLAEEYGVDEVSFRKKNNLYGDAWAIQPYGKKIDISKNYASLKKGDVINLSREQLPSDKKNNIPESKQHIGRISKIVDGVPYVKHFVAVGNNRKYYEEPINNISQFKEYKPVGATRLDSNIEITSGIPKMKFDRSYNPNGVELDVLKGDKSRSELQKKLSVNNEDYDKLSKMAYGVMGAESDYGRSKRSLFRMASPDFIQKGVKVTKDVFNGVDSYDENVNNLSQGYGSMKESSMHGISDSNEKYTKSTGKTAAQRVKSGDYKNLDRTNNYLYNAMTSLGLNADNMENGANSFKGTFAALATLKKRFPNASDEGLLKKYTGKKDITEYKNKYDSYLTNIDNIKGNDKKYTKTEDVLGSLSQLSNIGNEMIKTGKDHALSFIRDNVGAPIMIKAMVADMLGAKQPITNKSLSKGENEAMEKIANRVISSNKNSTDYQTYFPNLSKENAMSISGGVSGMGVWEKAKKMVSKEGQLQNTLGQSSVTKKGNNIVVKDTYDFNDQGKSFGFFDDIKKRSPDPYSIARSLARNFGSADGQGAPVELTYKNTNKKADGGFINNELNPKYNNYLNMRQYAQGGDLTRFDEGGTHESSPLGGIPQGQSPNGKQNTVEQGESKKGNFVYSNRISLNKDLVKQFNLPNYVANKSVSDASKTIDDKFKDRADKYAQETKDTLLNRLSQAQEYLKQQEQSQLEQANQSMQANSQQVPDQMNGQIPEGMEEYVQQEPQQSQDIQSMQTASPIAAFGGYQQNRYSGLDNPNSEMNVANPQTTTPVMTGAQIGTGAVGAAGTAMDLGQLAFGKAAQDTTGLAASGRVGGAGMIGGAALKGAQAGMAFGPWGAAIGGVVGGIAGVAGLGKARKAEMKNTQNFALNTNSQFQDQHAFGGEIDPPAKATRNQIANTVVSPTAKTNGNINSRYVNITGYQPGVTSGTKGAQGSYIYSPELSGGREFVDSSALAELHASPQWNTYQTNMKSQIAAEQAAGLPVSSYSNLNKSFALGGNMNEIFKVRQNLYPKAIQDLKMDNSVTDSSILKQYNNEVLNPNLFNTQKYLDADKYSLKNRVERVGETVNKNSGDALRLAPIAMNTYQLSKLKKPQGFQYNTLNNRYVPQYVDEAQMQRTIDQEGNNQVAAISQIGGSEGATRNAILGIGANKMRGLSDAYANASAQNRSQDAQAQQFNLGVDSQNITINNRAIDEIRADKGAYDSAKSKYLSSIGTDIGDIGKEKNASDAAIAMFGYTRKGKYVVDKNGNKVSPEILAKRQADFATYISEQNKKDNN